MKLPGFLSPLGLQLAGAALLLVVVVTLVGGKQIYSPGALSADDSTGEVRGGVRAHAELASNCAACHAPPFSSENMNDRCLECHTEIQGQLTDLTSLHGLLPDAQDCRACHTEHRGPQGYLTEISRLEIDHSQFGFSLAAHQTSPDGDPFACQDCHTESLVRFDPTLCESCHRQEDPRFTEDHIRAFSQDCRACHEGTDFFYEGRFDHNLLAFPLLGAHANAACIDCHVGVTNLAAFQDAPTDCVDCHAAENVHPPSFGTNCAICHNSERWDTEIFDHDLAAFKLVGEHQQVECTQCHVNDVYRGTPTECVACHAQDDVHLGQFGADCAACHTPEGWDQVLFEHTFPLDHGGLGTISCATCHTVPGNYEAYTCYNCHDPNDIIRQHAFAEMMRTDITDCVRCHDQGQSTMQMH